MDKQWIRQVADWFNLSNYYVFKCMLSVFQTFDNVLVRHQVYLIDKWFNHTILLCSLIMWFHGGAQIISNDMWVNQMWYQNLRPRYYTRVALGWLLWVFLTNKPTIICRKQSFRIWSVTLYCYSKPVWIVTYIVDRMIEASTKKVPCMQIIWSDFIHYDCIY